MKTQFGYSRWALLFALGLAIGIIFNDLFSGILMGILLIIIVFSWRRFREFDKAVEDDEE